MAVKTRVEAVDRDIDVILREDLSPQARSQALAKFADETIADASRQNRQILGREASKTIYVDGRQGAPLGSVRPDGEIIAEFDLFTDTLAWIGDQLERHSPRRSGRYAKSHDLFADGTLVEIGRQVPLAEEYVFINTLPYARKIEMGQSSQAPDGVYQAVATLARRRFGNIARVAFSYRTALAGSIVMGHAGNKSAGRYPAIVVTLPRR